MLNQLINVLMKLVTQLVNILPLSPFQPFIKQFKCNIPFVGYLNWLLPVKSMMVIAGTWLTAIALFYIYSAILRWVKAID